MFASGMQYVGAMACVQRIALSCLICVCASLLVEDLSALYSVHINILTVDVTLYSSVNLTFEIARVPFVGSRQPLAERQLKAQFTNHGCWASSST